jgi:malonyl-CoA O-methyltransferase
LQGLRRGAPALSIRGQITTPGSRLAMPLDFPRVRRAFSAAAPAYEQIARLQATIGDELYERLEVVKAPPARVVDVGSGTGRLAARLKQRWPRAELLCIDAALGMLRQARKRAGLFKPLRRIAGDARALPLPDRSVDLVVSSLCLQWLDDPAPAFREFARVLRPGGWLLFTTFGPDTLSELRGAWAAVDDAVHVHPFLDVMDIGNTVMAQGFAHPMFDVERHASHYPDVRGLMRELKGIGAGNADRARRRGLTGRQAFAAMQECYEGLRGPKGLPASWEVIFGQAQAPAEGQPLRQGGGEMARFDVESMRAALRRPRQ